MRRNDVALAFLILAAPLAAVDASMDSQRERERGLIERAVDDLMLRMQINIQLRSDAELASADIEADSLGGVVTLNGSPASAHLGDRAIQVARSVDGVMAVHADFEPAH